MSVEGRESSERCAAFEGGIRVGRQKEESEIETYGLTCGDEGETWPRCLFPRSTLLSVVEALFERARQLESLGNVKQTRGNKGRRMVSPKLEHMLSTMNGASSVKSTETCSQDMRWTLDVHQLSLLWYIHLVLQTSSRHTPLMLRCRSRKCEKRSSIKQPTHSSISMKNTDRDEKTVAVSHESASLHQSRTNFHFSFKKGALP